jgi:hypothetical protein
MNESIPSPGPMPDNRTAPSTDAAPLRPGLTRKAVDLFREEKLRVESSPVARLIMGAFALGIAGALLTAWIGWGALAIGCWIALTVILVLSVYVDVVFLLPTVILIAVFWSAATIAATIDIISRRKDCLHPPNRIVLAVHGVNIPALVLLVWLYLRLQ